MVEAIQLQGLGRFQAKTAKEIKVGKDYFMWNNGYTSKPVEIIKETSKTIVFKTVTEDGREWTRRLFKDRLVGYTTKEAY